MRQSPRSLKYPRRLENWMRTSLAQGATIVAIALSVCLSGAPTAAWGDSLEPPVPTGAEEPEIAAPDEPDPLFSDDFDDQLEYGDGMDAADPFESTNRKIFVFNQGVETVLLDPITKSYRFVVPEVARKGIHRAFLNLNSPKILVNDILQFRFIDAAETLGRFVLNTTIGLGGLFDAGRAAGWERHESDFGQTLAKFGVGSGPYLVVPFFGPSTVRDGFGAIVDLGFQPLTYILGPAELLTHVSITSGYGLSTIDDVHDEMKALESSSIDYYAALRSAYLQSRRALVEGVDPSGESITRYQKGDVSASPVP